MRRQEVTDIGNDLAAIASLAGVPVLWRCADSGEPWRIIPEDRVLHCNPCCRAVKSDPLRWGRCRVTESTDLESRSRERHGPWTKRCHAGLVELVVPIEAGGSYRGALLAGPWREPGGCAYDDAGAAWARLPLFDERRAVDLQRMLALLARRIAALAADPPAVDARIGRALAWIDAHFAGRYSAAAVAGAAGISASRLAHLVRAQTGRSLHQHLAERRVAEARRLLMGGDLPLHEIAIAAGFSDQSHLGMVFRRLTGMTPRRFRAVGGA